MTPDADISKGTLEQELLCFDSGPQVGTRVHTLAGSIWKILKGPEDTPKGGYLQWQERGREKAHRGGRWRGVVTGSGPCISLSCLCFLGLELYVPSVPPMNLLEELDLNLLPFHQRDPLIAPILLLCPKELKFNLQKDITSAKVKYGLSDLFRVSILRRVTFCLSLAW